MATNGTKDWGDLLDVVLFKADDLLSERMLPRLDCDVLDVKQPTEKYANNPGRADVDPCSV